MDGIKVAEMNLDTPQCCKNTYATLMKFRGKRHYKELYDTSIITQRLIVINRMYKLYNKLISLENVAKHLDIQLCRDSINIQSNNTIQTSHKLAIIDVDLGKDLSTFYVDICSSNDNGKNTIKNSREITNVIIILIS